MISVHTNELHCDRTLRPSRLLFCFQKPTSDLNARNANHECNADTRNIIIMYFQSVAVNISITSSTSPRVIPNDVIIVSVAAAT